jgi:diacylglycerol kinase (ATP)
LDGVHPAGRPYRVAANLIPSYQQLATSYRPMRRALLLYNPESGRRRSHRLPDVQAAAAAFKAAGIEPVLEPMRAPGSAASQARDAIARGCDAVIVCGGDGSVHEVLPALVGTPVALGVIPLGTGNGLAMELGLPRDPAKAAQLLASASIRPIAVPKVEYLRPDGKGDRRHWIIAVGIGADAMMVYRLALGFKERWGMAAYYAESTRQWLTHDFPLFTAEFRGHTGQLRREQVSQVLAVRISWFGGLLRRLVPGASLLRPDFHLVLFKTRNRLTFLRYMIGVWTNRPYARPDIEIVPSAECRCLPLDPGARSPSSAVLSAEPSAIDHRPSTRIYAEADGELLGALPITVTMSHETVNLLIPPSARGNYAVL